MKRRSVALSTSMLLLACQPGAPSAEDGETGPGASDGAGTSDGGATVDAPESTSGEPGTGTEGPITGQDSEGADPTAPPPKPTDAPSFACAGARHVVVPEPGRVHTLELASQTVLTALGDGHLADGENAAMLLDLDPAGAVVQTRFWAADGAIAAPYIQSAGYAAGELYVEYVEYPVIAGEASHTRLRKLDSAGATAFDLDLGLHHKVRPQPHGFALTPTGDTVLTTWDQGADTINALRHDASGALVWARTLESRETIQAIDAEGRMIATRNSDGLRVLEADGSVHHDIDFVTDYQGQLAVDGAGNVTIVHTSGGGYSVHVARFDPTGAKLWHISPPVPLGEARDIAINASGEIAIAGTALGEGPTTAFAIKLAPDGAVLGAHVCDTAADSQGNAVAIDDAGALYLGGFLWGEDGNQWAFVAAFD